MEKLKLPAESAVPPPTLAPMVPLATAKAETVAPPTGPSTTAPLTVPEVGGEPPVPLLPPPHAKSRTEPARRARVAIRVFTWGVLRCAGRPLAARWEGAAGSRRATRRLRPSGLEQPGARKSPRRPDALTIPDGSAAPWTGPPGRAAADVESLRPAARGGGRPRWTEAAPPERGREPTKGRGSYAQGHRRFDGGGGTAARRRAGPGPGDRGGGPEEGLPQGAHHVLQGRHPGGGAHPRLPLRLRGPGLGQVHLRALRRLAPARAGGRGREVRRQRVQGRPAEVLRQRQGRPGEGAGLPRQEREGREPGLQGRAEADRAQAEVAPRHHPMPAATRSHSPAPASPAPATRPSRSPRRTTFSSVMSTVSAAIHARFMTPAANIPSMSAQQHPRQ